MFRYGSDQHSSDSQLGEKPIHLADLMQQCGITFSLSKSCKTIPLHRTSLIFLMNRHPLTLTVPSSPLFTEAVLIWTIIRTSLQRHSQYSFCLHGIELTALHLHQELEQLVV
jgi:hypothetical protein